MRVYVPVLASSSSTESQPIVHSGAMDECRVHTDKQTGRGRE